MNIREIIELTILIPLTSLSMWRIVDLLKVIIN